MIRAFLAVLLDSSLRAQLAACQRSLQKRLAPHVDCSVRIQWVREDALHLTLKFLGDIAESQVDEIKRVIEPIMERACRLTIEFRRIGVFPDARAPRILWAGPPASAAAAALAQMGEAVDQAVGELGFPTERRPFQPHLTLARVKEGGRSVGQALLRTAALDQAESIGSLEVTAVHLMRSELLPVGARYESLWSVPCGAAGGTTG